LRVFHDGSVVVEREVLDAFAVVRLVEVGAGGSDDVVVVHVNEGIAVRPGLFVPDADDVSHFVEDGGNGTGV